MSEMSWLLADPGFVASGWTLLIILWQTTIVAVLLAMWRGIFRGAHAVNASRGDRGAFVLVVALAVSMPALLRAMPADGLPTVGPLPRHGDRRFRAADRNRRDTSPISGRPHGSTDWDSVAAAVTAGWISACSFSRRGSASPWWPSPRFAAGPSGSPAAHSIVSCNRCARSRASLDRSRCWRLLKSTLPPSSGGGSRR